MNQLEQDPREVTLSDLMYVIAMESREAQDNMKMLCSELRIPYPPVRIEPVLCQFRQDGPGLTAA